MFIPNENKFCRKSMVADTHNFFGYPDTSLHLNAELDPTFHFSADPDPAPHQIDANLQTLIYKPSTALF
jgi:hypothetical protein